MQPHLIENFKDTDYFDVPKNSWNLEGLETALSQGQSLCLKI